MLLLYSKLCIKDQFMAIQVNSCHHINRFLSDWIFHGKADASSSEFGLIIHSAHIHDCTRTFWTHAFNPIKESESFGFMTELIQMIVVCGKTINFLR